MRGRSPRSLSDEELFSELKRLVARERESTVEILRHLAELDRRSALGQTSTPSLFVYCVRELGYAEGAAYRRIRAARCAGDYPRIFILLKRGRITLTAVSFLAPHLTRENYRELLKRASGMTKYEVERLVASLDPKLEKRDSIKLLGPKVAPPAQENSQNLLVMTALPQVATSDPPISVVSTGGQARTGSPPVFAGLETPPMASADGPASGRVEFRFTGSEAFLAKVRRVREVLWHKCPSGKLEVIFDEAMEALLDKRDPWRTIPRRQKRRDARKRARLAKGAARAPDTSLGR